MDSWQMERMAVERQVELLHEAAAWHLEQEAVHAHAQPAKPDWFARYMFTFGNWMITAGERIRKRYEYTPPARRSMGGNVNR